MLSEKKISTVKSAIEYLKENPQYQFKIVSKPEADSEMIFMLVGSKLYGVDYAYPVIDLDTIEINAETDHHVVYSLIEAKRAYEDSEDHIESLFSKEDFLEYFESQADNCNTKLRDFLMDEYEILKDTLSKPSAPTM